MADKTLIGKIAKPFTMPVEWGKVREFARAIKDKNSVYFDPDSAKKECGGIPIPPTFLMASSFWQAGSAQDAGSALDVGFDTRRILHGEQEFEYYKPIFVGDVLTGVARIADLYEKEGGRGGKMTFAVVETEYTNQKGEKVALARSTLIETAGASKS